MYHEIEEENISPMVQQRSYNRNLESPDTHFSQKEFVPEGSYHRTNLDQSYKKQPSEQVFCAEHPDEMVNYFCFQCNCGNICAEWVIHGTHKGHDVQTLKKAHPLVCSKLEDLKSNVNTKIEELITSQQKLDLGKKDMADQVSGVKKRISDVFSDLKMNIERKEQEMLREADDFEDQNVKQIDNLLRLANGRAMNLSEHTHTIKDILNSHDHKAAWDFFSKNYEKIKESSTSDLPQLDQVASQAQARVNISSHNLNEILESLQNFKLDVSELGLKLQSNFTTSMTAPDRRQTAIYEERGKATNIFELGYNSNSTLKTSVAKTMNKLKQNMVYADPLPSKGPSFSHSYPDSDEF